MIHKVFKEGRRLLFSEKETERHYATILNCGNCVNQNVGSFEINFADFLPKDVTIKPKDIKLEGFQN